MIIAFPTSRGGGPPGLTRSRRRGRLSGLLITRGDGDIGFAQPLLGEDEFSHVVAFDSVPDPLKGVAEDHQGYRPPPQRPRCISELHDSEIAGQGQHRDGEGMKDTRGGVLMTDEPAMHPRGHKAMLMVVSARDNTRCQFGISSGQPNGRLPTWQKTKSRAPTVIACNPLSKNDL